MNADIIYTNGRFAELGAIPDLCPKLWHPSINKENAAKKAVGEERVENSWPIRCPDDWGD